MVKITTYRFARRRVTKGQSRPEGDSQGHPNIPPERLRAMKASRSAKANRKALPTRMQGRSPRAMRRLTERSDIARYSAASLIVSRRKGLELLMGRSSIQGLRMCARHIRPRAVPRHQARKRLKRGTKISRSCLCRRGDMGARFSHALSEPQVAWTKMWAEPSGSFGLALTFVFNHGAYERTIAIKG